MKTIELDYSKQCAGEPEKGTTVGTLTFRPPLGPIPGEEVVMQTRNALDGQVTSTSQPADLLKVNLDLVHPLTGPVYVNGAEPGDLLEVTILNIEPAKWDSPPSSPALAFSVTILPSPTSSTGT